MVEPPPPEPLHPELADLKLYDSRTRQVRRFEPLGPGPVGIYTCGPTVYAPQHLGNMRSQLVPDLLRRVLVAAGYEVNFVTNITDVGHLIDDRDDTDDKMELAAAASGETAADIAARYTEQWSRDRRRLGCLEPDAIPRATAHIDGQIAIVELLEQRGHTYRLDDGIYFDVTTFERYADFAGLDLDALETSGRVDDIEAKRHPADFALWKLTPPGVRRQQEWDSPWGRGFPGWHIECSAMSKSLLGENFDIHTGGVDHIRVHHTNEIAQTECAFGVAPWVNYWVHTEFLDLGGRKVSKSAGDILLVDSLVERGIDPLAFRYFFLQAHYRQQQAFSWEAMEAAATAHRRLLNHAAVARRDGAGSAAQVNRTAIEPHRSRFWAALADDLNAPRALAALWEATHDDALGPGELAAVLTEADQVLGLGLADAELPETDHSGTDERIDGLVAERSAARRNRDFETADRIRDQLAADNIELTDSPTGTAWRRIR